LQAIFLAMGRPVPERLFTSFYHRMAWKNESRWTGGPPRPVRRDLFRNPPVEFRNMSRFVAEIAFPG